MNKVKITTLSLYQRQYDALKKLVKDGHFRSMSEALREAMDFFFAFPYFRKVIEENEIDTDVWENYYNEKVVKVLNE